MPRDYDRPGRLVTTMNGRSRANQADRDLVNINSIISRYIAGQPNVIVSSQEPLYGDFTGPLDLHTQLNRVNAANERFQALPSKVRQAAQNDPVRFLEMFEDPEQLAVLTEAGLVVGFPDDQASPPPPSAASENPPVEPADPPALADS